MGERNQDADSIETAHRRNVSILDRLAERLTAEGCHSFQHHGAVRPGIATKGYAALTFQHAGSPEAHVGVMHPESEEEFIEKIMGRFREWRDRGYPTTDKMEWGEANG